MTALSDCLARTVAELQQSLQKGAHPVHNLRRSGMHIRKDGERPE